MEDKKKINKLKRGNKIREAKIEEVNGTGKSNFFEKHKRTILSIVLIALILGALLILGYKIAQEEPSETRSFKEEYESLNGKESSTGATYLELSIDDEIIQYADYEKIFSLLDHGTGVVYFGFPECPWCRTLVPVLLEAADEVGLDTIYYLNNKEDRDEKKLDDKGDIITTKEGSKEYKELLEKLAPYLGSYEGLEEDSIKRLYFPTVLFIKEGEIQSVHIGTIETQTSGYHLLTEEQKEELKNQLMEEMNRTMTCDEYC